MEEFIKFPKIPRYSRDCVVTEKIDGTNGVIRVTESGAIMAGSRSRWLCLENDNHGFCKWVVENRKALGVWLGVGTHFGEWWGQGINRGYGLKEKRFSLFNRKRWHEGNIPSCCHVVPILWAGIFPPPVHTIMEDLLTTGSIAAPGYHRPEGIVIFHAAGNTMFKKTFEKDEGGKDYELG
jgi:hypothetical protein